MSEKFPFDTCTENKMNILQLSGHLRSTVFMELDFYV